MILGFKGKSADQWSKRTHLVALAMKQSRKQDKGKS